MVRGDLSPKVSGEMRDTVLVKTIGLRLKAARERRNLTQLQLAKLVSQSSGAISRYEDDLREPSYKRANQLAVALGVDPNWLFSGSGTMEPSEASTALPIELSPLLKVIDQLQARVAELEARNAELESQLASQTAAPREVKEARAASGGGGANTTMVPSSRHRRR